MCIDIVKWEIFRRWNSSVDKMYSSMCGGSQRVGIYTVVNWEWIILVGYV